MTLTVIIPTYNRAHKILRVLKALDDQVCEGFTYVVRVMDDGSKDNTQEVLASYHPKNYKFFWDTQENSGPGAARNKLLEAVDTELVVIIGDDTTPARNFLEAHRKAHLVIQDEKLAVLGRTVWDKREPITTVMAHITGIGAQQFSYYYFKDGEYYDFRHFYTCNISIRTDFIRSLGVLFRHEFIIYGFEDIELGLRLEKKDLRILYQQDALAYHDHFYSVRGFCRRQFNCGISAKTFVDMHPEVRNILVFERIDGFKRQIFMPWVGYGNERFLERFDSVDLFEERVIRMLEAYEKSHIAALDGVYIALFNYFYLKGVACSTLKERARNRVISLVARKVLWPAVRQFVFEANSGAFPIPGEENERLMSALSLSH